MEDYGNDNVGREEALARVNGPATALLIIGILTVIFTLASTAYTMATKEQAEQQKAEALEQARRDGTEESVELIEQLYEIQEMASNPAFALLPLIFGVLIALGAMKMKKLEGRGFAKVSAILALIPCYGFCCILGIPFGIWALVVMSKPEVSEYFKS